MNTKIKITYYLLFYLTYENRMLSNMIDEPKINHKILN